MKPCFCGLCQPDDSSLRIDRAALERIFRSISDPLEFHLWTLTNVEVNKRVNKELNPYHGRLTKRARIRGAIGIDYETRVNLRREAEGKPADFRAESRTWGRPIPGTPLVQHPETGRRYLALEVLESLETRYHVDGLAVATEVVTPWLRPSPPAASRQDLESPVIFRTYALESIVAFETGSVKLEVIDAP